MGRFFNSLKGQLGRDTGRLVSNFIYGDKHSAPYRRVEQTSRKRKGKETAEADTEIVEARGNDTLWNSIGKAINGGEDEEEKKHREKVEALKGDMSSKIDELNQIRTPQEERELASFLLELFSLLHGNKWASDNGEETAIRNQYADLLFNRFGQGLYVMEAMFPNNRMLPTFRKDYKSFKRQRFMKKYLIWIIIPIVLVVFGSLLYQYAE